MAQCRVKEMDGAVTVASAATPEESDWLLQRDHHIPGEVMAQKIAAGQVLVARVDGKIVGWLRYGFFWDALPFMNMLFLEEPYRRQGIGRQLVAEWEARMAAAGHELVMTSTLSNEQGQHFYRALGYQDAGGLLLPEEPLELFLIKRVQK